MDERKMTDAGAPLWTIPVTTVGGAGIGALGGLGVSRLIAKHIGKPSSTDLAQIVRNSDAQTLNPFLRGIDAAASTVDDVSTDSIEHMNRMRELYGDLRGGIAEILNDNVDNAAQAIEAERARRIQLNRQIMKPPSLVMGSVIGGAGGSIYAHNKLVPDEELMPEDKLAFDFSELMTKKAEMEEREPSLPPIDMKDEELKYGLAGAGIGAAGLGYAQSLQQFLTREPAVLEEAENMFARGATVEEVESMVKQQRLKRLATAPFRFNELMRFPAMKDLKDLLDFRLGSVHPAAMAFSGGMLGAGIGSMVGGTRASVQNELRGYDPMGMKKQSNYREINQRMSSDFMRLIEKKAELDSIENEVDKPSTFSKVLPYAVGVGAMGLTGGALGRFRVRGTPELSDVEELAYKNMLAKASPSAVQEKLDEQYVDDMLDVLNSDFTQKYDMNWHPSLQRYYDGTAGKELTEQLTGEAEAYQNARLAESLQRIKRNKNIGTALGVAGGGALGAGMTYSNQQLDKWNREQMAHDFSDMMEKKAVFESLSFLADPTLWKFLGYGAAAHVAPNAVNYAIRNTDSGKQILEGQFASGYEQGKAGNKLRSGYSNVMVDLLGPESVGEYQLGNKIGRLAQKLEGMTEPKKAEFLRRYIALTDETLTPNQRRALEAQVLNFFNRYKDRATQTVGDFVDASKVREMPLFGTAVSYFENENKGQRSLLSKLTQKIMNTGAVDRAAKANVLDAGIRLSEIAALGAIEPHLLAQPGLNAIRKKIAESEAGKFLAGWQFSKGLRNQKVSKPVEVAGDLLISPAFADARRIGLKIREAADANPTISKNIANTSSFLDKAKTQIKNFVNLIK